MISSFGSYIQTANPNVVITKNNRKVNIGQIDANSAQYKGANQSTMPALRDGIVSQVNSVNGDNDAAEKLLSHYSKEDLLGPMLAGLPDLSNPKVADRLSQLTALYRSELADFQNQKSDLISLGRANGESAENILNDIIGLYDSQSDLLKTGIGWNGDVFAFDSSSPEGLARTQRYVTDGINIRA